MRTENFSSRHHQEADADRHRQRDGNAPCCFHNDAVECRPSPAIWPRSRPSRSATLQTIAHRSMPARGSSKLRWRYSLEEDCSRTVRRRPNFSQHGNIDRRSFLDGAGRFAVGGLTAGAIFEMMRPNDAWASRWRRRPTRPPPAFSSGSEPASRSRFRSTSPPWSRVAPLPLRRWRAGSTSSKWGRRCSRTRASRTSCQPSGSSFPRRSCWPT